MPEPHNPDTPSTSNESPAKRVCARSTFDEEEMCEDEDDNTELEEQVVVEDDEDPEVELK